VFMKRAGRNRQYTAHLQYEYGNLEFAQGDYQAAGRAYDLCRRINMDFNPLHPLTAAACYKLACNEFEQDHHKRALNFLDKALNIQDIRTNGVVDGTIARIMWKKAEILLDEPVGGRREEAARLRADAEIRQREIADELGIDLKLEDLEKEQDREKTFDLLVPGYFR
jgi:tetratricopeptide (TPR) repeat protein